MLDLKGNTLRLRQGMSAGDMSDVIRRHNRKCGRHGTQQMVTSTVQAQRGNERYRVISANYNDVVLVALHLMPGITFHNRAENGITFVSRVHEGIPELAAYGITPTQIVAWGFRDSDPESDMYGWSRKVPLALVCDIANLRYGEPRKERVVIHYGVFQQLINSMKEKAHDESSNL